MDIGRQKNVMSACQKQPRTFKTFRSLPISGALGAVLEGANLKAPSSDLIADIKLALHDHLVLFFYDQFLTPEELIKFGNLMGTLERHKYWKGLSEYPELFELSSRGEESVHYGSNWHSDLTCSANPPSAAILSAIEVPEVGGDTMFSNLYLAYESLSPQLQTILSQLDGVHESNFQVEPSKGQFNESGHSEKLQEHSTCQHPLVCTHPETGKQYLLANRIFTRAIDGMTKEESRGLLEYLFLHIGRPEFTCRFRWKAGAVALWDNRATAHYAIGDFRGVARRMQRVTLQGTKPSR